MMENITIKDEKSYFSIEASIPSELDSLTKELISKFILENKGRMIFKYNGYFKYTFNLKTNPIQIGETNVVLECNYGGNHQDIYKFDPDKFTLEGDGTDCVTIKLV